MTVQLEKVVQWYPGHMARAMRRIGAYVKLADIVVEVVDARIPRSGRNPMLDALIGSRTRLLVLSREDLADPHATKAWIAAFERAGLEAIAVDARSQPSVARVGAVLTRSAARRRGIARVLVVGLPNSAKSCTINGLLRRAAAKTEDRAGVTRQLQWFRLSQGLELMDTPGILVPKIATPQAQWMLALCGALPRERYDPEHVVDEFHRWLVRERPRAQIPDLQTFAAARGALQRGGAIDYHNAARSYVREFNEGGFGRLSFETVDDAKTA
ncbi:MAG TPA: ribosome biogenesis GTPase YlqF [Candidatus Tumulicola sp.]|jgi:ribosome biogenesis GTPase A